MADTWGPYHAAYAIVAVFYSSYAFSIWWRAKKVQEKLRRAKAVPSPRS